MWYQSGTSCTVLLLYATVTHATLTEITSEDFRLNPHPLTEKLSSESQNKNHKNLPEYTGLSWSRRVTSGIVRVCQTLIKSRIWLVKGRSETWIVFLWIRWRHRVHRCMRQSLSPFLIKPLLKFLELLLAKILAKKT